MTAPASVVPPDTPAGAGPSSETSGGGGAARLRPWATAVTLGGICVACALTAYQHRHATWDDPYIYARVVRNVLDGKGWTYNPDRPLNPCTSPLFFAMTLATSALTGSIPTAMSLLHAMTLAAAAGLLFVGLHRRTGWVMATLTAFGFLHHPYVTFLDGVETCLLLAFALASVLAYAERRYMLTAILLSLTVLSRGDGALLAVLVLIHYVVARRRLPSLRLTAAFVALPLLWSVLHWAYFGSPLPATLAAKTAQGASGHWHTYLDGLQATFASTLPPLARRVVHACLLLSAVGLLLALLRRDRPALLLGLFAVLHAAAYQGMHVAGYHWYYGVEYLAVWYVTATSLALGYRFAARRRWPRVEGGLTLLAWAAMLILIALLADFRAAYRFAPHSRVQGYLDLARAVRAHLNGGDRLLTAEIGALGWALPDQIVEDTVGLTGFVMPDEVADGQFGAWLARTDRLPDHVLILDRFAGRILDGDVRLALSFPRLYRSAARFEGPDPLYYATLWSRRNESVPGEADGDEPLLLLMDPARFQPPTIRPINIVADGRLYAGLFQHPPHEFPVRLTVSRPRLAFGYGMLPDVYDRSDGVRFTISLTADGQSHKLFQRDVRMDAGPAARRWHFADVDLTRFLGRDVVLMLATDTLETPTSDWAVWLNPRLTERHATIRKPDTPPG